MFHDNAMMISYEKHHCDTIQAG